jgi:hypothetical protein
MEFTQPIQTLHSAMWTFIDQWGTDPAGPWWEADLSFDIGQVLMTAFAKQPHEKLVELERPPSFLKSWPQPIKFRRLGTNNYFRATGWTTPREREQEIQSDNRVRGKWPDHYYRQPGKDRCDWVVELKLWSVDGTKKLADEVKGCVSGLERDAEKWTKQDISDYAFCFSAVNTPENFDGNAKPSS